MMPMMSPPPPRMLPVGFGSQHGPPVHLSYNSGQMLSAPAMRLPMPGHMKMVPQPPMMRPPACPIMVPTRPGMT